MNKVMKISIVAVLASAAAVVFAMRDFGEAETLPAVTPTVGRHRFVALGGGKCLACRQMAPVLERLRTVSAGKLDVVIIDVMKNPKAGKTHGVRVIPTQIIYAYGEKEVYRHTGFISAADILSKFRELEMDVGDPAAVRDEPTSLFETVGRCLEGTVAVSLAAAFVWGILSVLLSPCHLASIPLIVALINRQGPVSKKRAFLVSASFAVGILFTIAAIGLITRFLGGIVGDVGGWAYYFVAAIFFAAGLHLLDVIPAPWSAPTDVKMKRRGILAALILGLVFGIALGPCTIAYMLPMLSIAYGIASPGSYYGVVLLVAYAAGHCSVIVLAGTSTSLVQHYLNWTEESKVSTIIKRTCGVLVLLGGLYLIYIAS